MLDPSPATPSASASGATEVVERPQAGLGRGLWEAPAWLFWAFLAVVILGAAAYLLRRLGVLRLGRAGATDAAPPSSSPTSARPRRP